MNDFVQIKDSLTTGEIVELILRKELLQLILVQLELKQK